MSRAQGTRECLLVAVCWQQIGTGASPLLDGWYARRWTIDAFASRETEGSWMRMCKSNRRYQVCLAPNGQTEGRHWQADKWTYRAALSRSFRPERTYSARRGDKSPLTYRTGSGRVRIERARLIGCGLVWPISAQTDWQTERSGSCQLPVASCSIGFIQGLSFC